MFACVVGCWLIACFVNSVVVRCMNSRLLFLILCLLFIVF